MRGVVLRRQLFCPRSERGLAVRHSVRMDLGFLFVDAMRWMRLLPLYGVRLLVAWQYAVLVWCSIIRCLVVEKKKKKRLMGQIAEPPLFCEARQTTSLTESRVSKEKEFLRKKR